jgi:hypothetical protein
VVTFTKVFAELFSWEPLVDVVIEARTVEKAVAAA